MNTQKITRISIVLLFLTTIVLSLTPAIQTLQKGTYAGVPPAYVDDDIYYYGRIKEVHDGHLLVSNPYFIEYRDSRPGVFFVADWLAAVPTLLGVPFSLAIVANLVFWSLLFVFLVYFLVRAMGMSPPLSAGLACIAYGEVYWLIFRPVIMQEVFPFFLLFLLALFWWLRNPLQYRSTLFLIVASAASFYIYTFLWQVIVTTLAIVFLHLLVQKKWSEIKALLWVGFGSTLLALLAIINIFHQIHSPFYWETLDRINLIKSHLPSMDAYHYGRWALILTTLYICARQWFKTHSVSDDFVTRVAIYSGVALALTSIGNVFMGKDLSMGQHIGRFITLWMALFFPILIWKFWRDRKELVKLQWSKLGVIGLLSLACFSFLLLNLRRSLPFQEIATIDSTYIQAYAAPLHWLQEREKQPVVIWANREISMYVPILTKHYVFWAQAGGLFFMPTEEVEDRFLASQTKELTLDELFVSYELFEGSGVLSRYADLVNKNRLQCLIGRECPQDQSLREWIGTSKLESLAKRQLELRKDIVHVMKKYRIAYLIADTSKGEDVYFRSLPSAEEVWKDNRFIVYEIE